MRIAWTRGVVGLLSVWVILPFIALAVPAVEAAGSPTAESTEPLEPVVSAPEQTAISLSQEPLLRTRIVRAWTLPARNLDERVERTLRAGYQLGMLNLEAPARAVLMTPGLGSSLNRAQAAVRLAPDLPASHAALGLARLQQGKLVGAIESYIAALRCVPKHLEATLWSRTEGTKRLVASLVGGSAFFLFVVAMMAVPRFLRDLAVIREDLPLASRMALLASLLLLPAALGEGWLGTVLVLSFLAVLYGNLWRRIVVAGASLSVLCALYPLLEESAEARLAMVGNTVVWAVHATEHGFPTASELAQVRYVEDHSPLAQRALALRAKRQGNLMQAHQRYTSLLQEGSEVVSADLLNNAAGAALAMGLVDEATRLFEEANTQHHSAVILFNLSQAYGKAVRLDEQSLALTEAQAIDAEEVSRLTGDFGATALGLVTDIALPASQAEAALSPSTRSQEWVAHERQRFAPGWLGGGIQQAGTALGASLVLGLSLGLYFVRRTGDDAEYRNIARILQGHSKDASDRMQQLAKIRQRQALARRAAKIVSWLVPGSAGLLRGRPLLGFVSAVFFSFAIVCLGFANSAALDPLVMGNLAEVLRIFGVGFFAFAYGAVLMLVMALPERDS